MKRNSLFSLFLRDVFQECYLNRMNFFGQCFKLRFPIELMLNWMATQNMTVLYLKGDRVRFTNLLTVLVRYAQAWAYGIHFAAFVLPVENLSLDMVIRLERFTIENR